MSVNDDTQLWGEKFSSSTDDLLQVEGELAATIAAALIHRLSGADHGRLARAATADPEAYRLYLRGRSFLIGNQQEMDKGVDCFLQAVARAPGYAMAHAGLAEAYTLQAYLRAVDRTVALGKAQAAVTRALELDPDLAEAHAALGMIRYYFEWDWAGAEVEFRRALELNPGSQAGHEAYGEYLMAMGRLDEAFDRSSEAARLDPLSTGPVHNLAIIALVRGDHAQAAAGFRRAIDINPNWTWGYIKLARTLALQKKSELALVQAGIAEGRIAGGNAPMSWSWLGVTYAACGDPARAREKLDRLHELERRQYVDPVAFASIHARSAKSTRRCAGTKRPSRTGRRTWCTRPAFPRSPPSWPATPLSGDRGPHGLSAVGEIAITPCCRSPPPSSRTPPPWPPCPWPARRLRRCPVSPRTRARPA